jgi:hypothetical protein
METHFVFAQMHKKPGKILWLLESGSTINLSLFRRHIFVPIKTDTKIKGIGDLQLDEELPLVISVVADDATYFTIQHPEVLYAQNFEFPIM